MKFQTGWITSWNQDCQENINNLRHADDTTLAAESEKELKIFLMRVKEESEKAGLKLNIQKKTIMASSPISSWQIDGEIMETLTDFIFWAPKSLWTVTAAKKLKTIVLTIWIFVGKVMSLLLNTLSRFFIAFLPRSKYLLISCMQSPS